MRHGEPGNINTPQVLLETSPRKMHLLPTFCRVTTKWPGHCSDKSVYFPYNRRCACYMTELYLSADFEGQSNARSSTLFDHQPCLPFFRSDRGAKRARERLDRCASGPRPPPRSVARGPGDERPRAIAIQSAHNANLNHRHCLSRLKRSPPLALYFLGRTPRPRLASFCYCLTPAPQIRRGEEIGRPSRSILSHTGPVGRTGLVGTGVLPDLTASRGSGQHAPPLGCCTTADLYGASLDEPGVRRLEARPGSRFSEAGLLPSAEDATAP